MTDFFEITNEMLCVADHRGYFLKVNAAWTKTLGWSTEELTTRPYADFVHPDDLAATAREANLLAGGKHQTVEFENRYRCKEGGYRWLAWRVVQEPGSERLIASARDVTEQKAQTQALRVMEQQFRTLVTHAPVGIARADAQGEVYLVNAKWCELAGVTPEETLGRRWQEHVHPEDLPGLLTTWMEHVRSGRDMPAYEFRFRHKSGEVRWASASVAMLTDGDGRVTGQIATVEDVTQRKSAELAVRETEERFRAFMDHTPTIAWAKDERGEIVFLNQACEKFFRIAPGGWRGKTDFDFWPAEVAERLQANDRRVLESNEPLQFIEQTPSAEHGADHWMTFLFPYRDGRGRRYVGGVAVDITPLKNSEAALESKTDVLRNLIDAQEHERQRLCHEFHDGLIQYSVGALMSLEGYRSAHPQADDAEQIDAAIASLRKGVEDGRRTIRGIRPAVLDDSDLAAACNDLVEQFSTPGFCVNCNCDPGIGRLPERLQTTAYRLIQESLNNARKHSGADAVQIDVCKQNDELRVDVRDTGRGFDPTDRTQGFGLDGMNERVRLLNGELTVRSEPSGGTQIQIRLPILHDDDGG